jgi:VWFA-related protein
MTHPEYALGVIAAAIIFNGSNIAAQQRPTFKSSVELATLDVTVSDRDGNPIQGLRADEFVVEIDGQKTPVEAMQYLTVDAATAPPGSPTAAALAPAAAIRRPFRVVVFLIDDLSMPARPLQAVMQPALEMLTTLGPDDLVGAVTTSGLGPVVNPTRDKSAVRAALLDKRMSGRISSVSGPYLIASQEAVQIEDGAPGVLERVVDRECTSLNQPKETCEATIEHLARSIAQMDVYRSQQQLQAMQRVINALRGGPSPKILVVISSGLVMRGSGDLPRRVDALSRAAADAGVIIYGLDEVPSISNMSDTSADRATARREEALFLTSGLQSAVESTGGQAFLIIGQPKRFVQRVLSETSAFYRLGIRIPAGASAGPLRVQVTTTHHGATARANRHVIPPKSGGAARVPSA